MANEEEHPSALSDNQVKACACGKPSAETWERCCQTLQTLFRPPPWAPGRGGVPPRQRWGDSAAGTIAASKGVPAARPRTRGRLLLLRCLCMTHGALGAIRLRQSRRFLRGSPTPCRLGTALSGASPERDAVSSSLPSPKRRKPRYCGEASSGGRSRKPLRAATAEGLVPCGSTAGLARNRPLAPRLCSPPAKGSSPLGTTSRGRCLLCFCSARSAVTRGHRPPTATSARDARGNKSGRAWGSTSVGQPRLPLWPRCRTPEPALLSISLPQVFVLTCIYLPASLLRWVLPPRPFGAGEGGGSSRRPACTWPLVLLAAPSVPKPGVWELASHRLCREGTPYPCQPLPISEEAEHRIPTGMGSLGSHRAGPPTALLRRVVNRQPRLFQPPGQRIGPRCHLPAEAMLPHPGGCRWLPGAQGRVLAPAKPKAELGQHRCCWA